MVIDPDSDVVVVCEPGSEAQSKIRLGRIGFDNVVGAIEESAAALATRPDLMEVASRLRVDQLRERMRSVPDLVVVDVRGPGERSFGAIEASVPIPIAALRSRLDELDPARPTVVYCAGGYRSSVAASVLRAHGFLDVSDLIGGYGAWLHSESGLVCHRVSPLNCETALTELIGGTVMPNARFYVRNHFETPTLDAESWRLEVRGAVDNPLRLSLRDLRRYPSRSAVVTLECAGNGRSTLVPPVDGEQWGLGAVSTAEWTGVPLGEVLDRAGVQASAREVVFRGADRGAAGTDDDIAFDRSLSLPDARDPDVLLAYAMNGEPLPLQHGYPLRLVVPRWYAVASVKWLAEIEVIEHAFQGHFQGDKYVYEWERGTGVVCEPVTTKRVRALILEPVADDVVEAGELVVRGVAWSGAAPIDRVEVMIGDGPPQTARLLGTPSASAWQWWELVTRAGDPGWVTIRARATDAAGNVQPDEPEWNRLGYGNNAVQQLSVLVRPGTPRPAAAR
jgi:DMSO/TMAO reductase YedYZ molybdopterin-dependent catalytic subunit